MDPIIIIGSGLAGYGVARELRKIDQHVPLLMITADDGASYSKPMLSNAFAKNKSPEALVMANADKMAEQLNMTVMTHTRVTRIDTETKSVLIGNVCCAYQSLVLAMGANPIRPTIDGTGAGDVLSVNSLSDYKLFRQQLAGKQHVAILGGGLIGCEFANDLTSAGINVSIVDRASQPLGRLLPPELGKKLGAKLAEQGVEWYSDTSIKTINREGDGYSLETEDGRVFRADLVLSAIGLQANTQLAKEAGMEVNRGIVVDQYLQTSAQGVYALGDVAEVNGAFLPFIMPLMRCTKALALTLAGDKTGVHYPAMPVSVKTPVMPLSIVPPAPGVEGEWQISEDEEGIEALFYRNDQSLAGFALSDGKTRLANELASKI